MGFIFAINRPGFIADGKMSWIVSLRCCCKSFVALHIESVIKRGMA